MKHFRKIFALCITVIMLASFSCVIASAQELAPMYINCLGSFPQISKGSGNRNYVLGLQRFLMCFDYVSRNKLSTNGKYMDGYFGPNTEDSTVYFQTACGYTEKWCDGIVGSETWKSMGRRLYSVSNTEMEGFIFMRDNYYVFGGFDYAGNPIMFYYDENGTNPTRFN